MSDSIQEFKMFIDGQFVDSESGERAESINPATGEKIAEFPSANKDDVLKAAEAAKKVFDEGEWSSVQNSVNRGRILKKIAEQMREQLDELAELESQDSGKTITESSLVDVHLAADTFEYFGDLATQIYGEILPVPANGLNLAMREPIGVCGAIGAWNFPILFAAWKMAPCIATGNTMVYKPAELTSLSTLALCKILDACHLPAGVVNVVTGAGSTVGEAMVEHPDIKKISFTGSGRVGQHVAAKASQNFKKVTLELGGKSPFIVFDDAEIDNAVSACLNGIFFNGGQCCIAGSRLLLHENIYDEFVEKLVERTKLVRVGLTSDWDTNMGAIISPKQKQSILKYIQAARDEGQKILCGGTEPDPLPHPGGNYLLPTLIEITNPEAKVCQEEIFGPVLSILKFKDEEEAIQIANDTEYGLASGVWTSNIKRGIRVAKKIQAGQVWINQYLTLNPFAPHGGYKHSGYGKDNSKYCLEEYTQIKNVFIDLEEGEYICLYD